MVDDYSDRDMFDITDFPNIIIFESVIRICKSRRSNASKMIKLKRELKFRDLGTFRKKRKGV